jgi:tryptophan synthase beta subunit
VFALCGNSFLSGDWNWERRQRRRGGFNRLIGAVGTCWIATASLAVLGLWRVVAGWGSGKHGLAFNILQIVVGVACAVVSVWGALDLKRHVQEADAEDREVAGLK